MSISAPKLATDADLLKLPEDVRAEILGGQIITSPTPLPKHSRAQRALGSFIGDRSMMTTAAADRGAGGFSSKSTYGSERTTSCAPTWLAGVVLASRTG